MANVDVKFFKPFIDGTVNTLKIQCKTEATLGKAFIKGTQPQPPFQIAGVINVQTNAFSGNVTLCFPAQTYLKIMTGMLGEEFKEITQELQDGAAELLNIIFGSAKLVLNMQGYNIQKAIPRIIRGEGLQTKYQGAKAVVVIPFATNSGDFQIEISTEGPPTT